ncbi:MAG: hypothetical protein WDZ45_10420 [Flavobacteriaceae bacterium]
MNKIITIFILCVITGCATKKLTSDSDSNEFYPIGTENSKFLYAKSNAYVNHRDISKTTNFDGKKYQTRVIEYSWGKKVETFYRIQNGNVLYYDTQSESENLIMPQNPVVGYKWKNSDQSWEYEIIDLNGELKTPVKNYSGLLIMKATQLKNRDETKLTEYLNYYQRNVGKVASIGNGELMTYRTY